MTAAFHARRSENAGGRMSMLSWGNMAQKIFLIIQIYTYTLNLISSLNPEAIWHSVSFTYYTDKLTYHVNGLT
jgi:hypothetical protein